LRGENSNIYKGKNMEKYKVIDLFCGIGGFSYGFEMTKSFEVVLGVDLWEIALETFKTNHPSTELLLKDLSEVEDNYWEQYSDKIDVIIAGPPCQGFSMSGKRDINDERNSLFLQVVRAAKIINPKYVLIENVVGLLSMKNSDGEDIKKLIENEFRKIGYQTSYKILNAAEFGVPQARKRVVFIISKILPREFPKPNLNSKEFITVSDALGNIDPDGQGYFKATTAFQKRMRGPKLIHNHIPRTSNELVKKRMSHIPKGGNWRDIPQELGTGGGTHSNAYKRLDPQKPSVTIKHAAKAMIIHPDRDRILTVREAARLQSFDDSFKLVGSVSDQHQQLANAVPPLLGEALANEIKIHLDKNKTSKNTYKFIDLFSGLGGFRIAFENNNASCVFSSEIDKYAREQYYLNFNEYPSGDITKVNENDIPDHDILCAGFPCQSFSIAGKRLGFKDTRGTLFFDIARILKAKKPMAFLIENVKGIINHDSGKTLQVILAVVDEVGYEAKFEIINSKDFGIPQSRERWYCVGIRKDLDISINQFEFPAKSKKTPNLLDFLENKVDHKYEISDKSISNVNYFIKQKNIKVNEETLAYEIRPSRCQFKLDGIAPTLTAKMGTGGNNVPVLVDKMRKLTERECLNLMGYPKSYKFNKGYQTYKQAGNSVVIPVINLLAKELIRVLNTSNKKSHSKEIDLFNWMDN
jgi:DNA (cytosine-5)-methyltransferase 1